MNALEKNKAREEDSHLTGGILEITEGQGSPLQDEGCTEMERNTGERSI